MLPSNYILTAHAERALEKRSIPIVWVRRVLDDPIRIEADSMDPALSHRLAPILEFDNRILRVIVNQAVMPYRIVTVFFDRRERAQ